MTKIQENASSVKSSLVGNYLFAKGRVFAPYTWAGALLPVMMIALKAEGAIFTADAK